MDAGLVVGAVGVVLAGISLWWQIRRDRLKPRIQVSFGVKGLVDGLGRNQKFVCITGVNHGPGKLHCTGVHIKTAPLWRVLFTKVKYGFLIPDWNNPNTTRLPIDLDVGQTVHFFFNPQDCTFMNDPFTHIGFADSFNSYHWSSRSTVRHAKKVFAQEFGGAI